MAFTAFQKWQLWATYFQHTFGIASQHFTPHDAYAASRLNSIPCNFIRSELHPWLLHRHHMV